MQTYVSTILGVHKQSEWGHAKPMRYDSGKVVLMVVGDKCPQAPWAKLGLTILVVGNEDSALYMPLPRQGGNDKNY